MIAILIIGFLVLFIIGDFLYRFYYDSIKRCIGSWCATYLSREKSVTEDRYLFKRLGKYKIGDKKVLVVKYNVDFMNTDGDFYLALGANVWKFSADCLYERNDGSIELSYDLDDGDREVNLIINNCQVTGMGSDHRHEYEIAYVGQGLHTITYTKI